MQVSNPGLYECVLLNKGEFIPPLWENCELNRYQILGNLSVQGGRWGEKSRQEGSARMVNLIAK